MLRQALWTGTAPYLPTLENPLQDPLSRCSGPASLHPQLQAHLHLTAPGHGLRSAGTATVLARALARPRLVLTGLTL